MRGDGTGGHEVSGQIMQGLGGHSEEIAFTLRGERALGRFSTEGSCDLTGVNRTCLAL